MKVVIEKHDGTKYTYDDIVNVASKDQYTLVLFRETGIAAIENKGDIKNLHTVEPE
ncbi:hypothetical protein [Pseudomonas sp. ZL2]